MDTTIAQSTPELPPLVASLPDMLEWLEPEVIALQRPVAWSRYRSSRKEVILPRGSTRRSVPDLPVTAPWAQGLTPEHFSSHHQDAPSLVLQLNLADIPAAVARPGWPRVGVLWVFLKSGRRNVVSVEFDPRPAQDIEWQVHPEKPTSPLEWDQGISLPYHTESILPVLWNWQDKGSEFDNWAWTHYQGKVNRSVVLGGWSYTNQGDLDEDSQEFVLAIKDLCFGDSGEVYVFFNPERGFYSRADIC